MLEVQLRTNQNPCLDASEALQSATVADSLPAIVVRVRVRVRHLYVSAFHYRSCPGGGGGVSLTCQRFQ